MTTLNLQVAASADDATENVSTGVVTLTYSVLYGLSGYMTGMRFQAAIPQGENIISAYVSIYTYDSNHDSANLNIYGQVNAPVFTTTDYSISSRGKTANYTNWTAADLGASEWKNSPDISAVIQEIVDDGSWASGNYIGIFFVHAGTGNDLYFRSYNNSASTAPKLIIEYGSAATAKKSLIRGFNTPLINSGLLIRGVY